jgi:hypothetical protein
MHDIVSSRFAIVWIPLVLLIIFNTVLIVYVHRSRQSERNTSEGIKLRRHNRGNQGEQRKTTIMLSTLNMDECDHIVFSFGFHLIVELFLVAVVIVFTVCQIPQAISLTVQSFFPKLSRSSKVLIYNNFANCLVAVNASINFVLYCCFSDRFRLTFRSSFAFLSKYCAHYMKPNRKLTQHVTTNSPSLDNMSYTMPYNQSTYSLQSTGLRMHMSNMRVNVNRMCLKKTIDTSPSQARTSVLPTFNSREPFAWPSNKTVGHKLESMSSCTCTCTCTFHLFAFALVH